MKGPMVWFGHKALPPCSGLGGWWWWCNIYEDDQNCDGEDETGCDQRSSNSVFFCKITAHTLATLHTPLVANFLPVLAPSQRAWWDFWTFCDIVTSVSAFATSQFCQSQSFYWTFPPFLVCSWWAPMGGLGPTPLQRRSPLHWHFEKTKTFLA